MIVQQIVNLFSQPWMYRYVFCSLLNFNQYTQLGILISHVSLKSCDVAQDIICFHNRQLALSFRWHWKTPPVMFLEKNKNKTILNFSKCAKCFTSNSTCDQTQNSTSQLSVSMQFHLISRNFTASNLQKFRDIHGDHYVFPFLLVVIRMVISKNSSFPPTFRKIPVGFSSIFVGWGRVAAGEAWPFEENELGNPARARCDCAKGNGGKLWNNHRKMPWKLVV